MFITKEYTVSVDLFYVAEIYSANKELLLLDKIKKNYSNRCFGGMLIMEILAIKKYSFTKLVSNRLDGSAYIDVTFIAKGIIFLAGEVITGCHVVSTNPTEIIIDSKNMAGTIQPNKKIPGTETLIKYISEGSNIPAIVTTANYNPNKNQITLAAIPFVPLDVTNVIYKFNKMTLVELSEINALVEKLDAEIKDAQYIADSNELLHKTYARIMYPFKNIQKFEISELGSKFEKITMDKLLDKSNGYLIAPIEAYNSSDLELYYTENLTNLDHISYITLSGSLHSALCGIIMKRILYIQAISNLTLEYNTTAKLESLKNYLIVFNSLKH